jgi:hypothetical protein
MLDPSPLLPVTPLSEVLLAQLVAELDNEHIRGICLGGSHARGEATPYSDVDIACFVPDSYRPLRKRFMYRDGQLVSIALKTLEGVRQQISEPDQALWIVPSFRQSRVLLDKDGSMRQLKQMVEEFSWEPLRSEAIGFAGHILICDAELVHKLFSNLWKGNLSGVSYVTTGLLESVTEAMMLYHAVFITTDSLYYEEVERAVGLDTRWTHYHRLLTGTETGPEETGSIEVRAKVALHLYAETASLLYPVLSEQRRAVIEEVLRMIEGV